MIVFFHEKPETDTGKKRLGKEKRRGEEKEEEEDKE
jgi:hypothetical protein